MAAFRTLDDIGDVKGKRVLVRVDLNVPVDDGKVTDATRIERVAPTILELSDKGAKVVLLAHFGRPKDGPDPPSSRSSRSPRHGRALSAARSPSSPTASARPPQAAVVAMKPGDIALLENTRFHKGEEKNDPDFTEALAANGDLFVNDAFSAAHRAHASTEGLARILPAYAGRTMQAELAALEKGLGNPKRPVVAIVGGAKVSSKLDLLHEPRQEGRRAGHRRRHGQYVPRRARRRCRQVAVRTRPCPDRQADHGRGRRRGLRDRTAVDGVVAREFKAGAANETVAIDAVPADAMMLDVGPKTVEAVNEWIDRAATLVWNGPLGAFEIEPFDRATVAVARHAAKAHAGPASSSRSPAAATRLQHSTTPASPTISPTSRPPAARSSNGWKARIFRASQC